MACPSAAGLIATLAGGGGGVVVVVVDPADGSPEHAAASSPVTANTIAGHLFIATRPSGNTSLCSIMPRRGADSTGFLCTRTLSGPDGLLDPPDPERIQRQVNVATAFAGTV
jgi:hypothetical protein